MSKTFPVTLTDILKAQSRIKSHVHRTPVLTSSTFDRLYGRKFFFKSENLQKTGSFKARGALNAVCILNIVECQAIIIKHLHRPRHQNNMSV